MRLIKIKSILFVIGFFLFQSVALKPNLQAQTLSVIERNDLAEKGYQSSSGYALPATPGLTDYTKTMIYNNPAIRSAYASWQVEVKKIAVARGLPDPKISFGYFLENTYSDSSYTNK